MWIWDRNKQFIPEMGSGRPGVTYMGVAELAAARRKAGLLTKLPWVVKMHSMLSKDAS